MIDLTQKPKHPDGREYTDAEMDADNAKIQKAVETISDAVMQAVSEGGGSKNPENMSNIATALIEVTTKFAMAAINGNPAAVKNMLTESIDMILGAVKKAYDDVRAEHSKKKNL